MTPRTQSRRFLVSLSPDTVTAIEALRQVGIDNKRFGCQPSSLSDAMKRLIIIGLEKFEEQQS